MNFNQGYEIKDTESTLQMYRRLVTINETDRLSLSDYDMRKERIYYVSDIHLLHKLEYFEAESEGDVAYIIKSFVENIVKESGNIILIGGDVSSKFSIFELFIKSLRSELDSRGRNPLVIFVLGNHELWEFPQNSFDEIVTKYNDLINDCGMYLLQNNILFIDYKDVVHRITTKELLSLEDKGLRAKIKTSRITFFGGLAFSGYNEFNANKGIYRRTIDRATEIEESEKFGELYKKVCSTLSDKKVIVFTHMPMNCWSENEDYHKNFIYVSGHTHRNNLYDDGEIRVYADNQIGNQGNDIHMKCFNIEYEYHSFANYDDGIHKISAQEYKSFYRSKNMHLEFNENNVNILYMLKKNGYYCFIHESKGGSLTILHGGSRERLDIDDINYYYDNMDSVVAFIKKPLDAYTNIQEAIAAEIRKIGGRGYIHGCIIDIDFYNHVYVNPVDMKITGYWALDTAYKKVYSSVPALLKQERPDIYEMCTKSLKESSNNLPILANYANSDLDQPPQIYYDKDIYELSREMNKMQRLNSNILTTWDEVDNVNKMIESKPDK